MLISKFSDAIKHELQQCKTEEEIKSVTSKMISIVKAQEIVYIDNLRIKEQQCLVKENPVAPFTFNQIANMSPKDKERFEQCFYCDSLETCKHLEEAENEEGLCKFFKAMNKEKAKAFSEALQEALKEAEENEHN